MTCERVEALLSALIDQELDSKTSSEVEQHLRACASCAETLRELRLMVQASAELEPINPPDRLYGDIRRKIRNLQHRPRFAPSRIGWVFIPALATAVLMLVIFPRHPATARFEPSATIAAAPPAETMTDGADAAVPVPRTPERSEPAAARPRVRSESRSAAPVYAARAEITPAVLTLASSTPANPAGHDAQLVLAAGGGDEVVASLRGIQQALEEIEAALQRNPGNQQVLAAYQATYAKGREIQSRYSGAR